MFISFVLINCQNSMISIDRIAITINSEVDIYFNNHFFYKWIKCVCYSEANISSGRSISSLLK